MLGTVAALTAAFYFIARMADGGPAAPRDHQLVEIQTAATLLACGGALFLVLMTPIYLLRRETERRLRRRFGPATLNIGGQGVPAPPLSDRQEHRHLSALHDRVQLGLFALWVVLLLADHFYRIPPALETFTRVVSWVVVALAFSLVARGALRGQEKAARAERNLPPIPKR